MLELTYARIVDAIEKVIKITKDNNGLDSQEFLEFLDRLNYYSIDPDREDTSS